MSAELTGIIGGIYGGVFTPTEAGLVIKIGFDPMWFGVIMVLVMEMGLITPPVGLNVFALSGVTGISLHIVFRGVLPFVLAMALCILLLIIFPQLALTQPDVE